MSYWKIFLPISLAITLARCVLPTPGGPARTNTPGPRVRVRGRIRVRGRVRVRVRVMVRVRVAFS